MYQLLDGLISVISFVRWVQIKTEAAFAIIALAGLFIACRVRSKVLFCVLCATSECWMLSSYGNRNMYGHEVYRQQIRVERTQTMRRNTVF